MSGTLADTYYNFANLASEIPLRAAQTAEAYSKLPENYARAPYTQAATAKTQVETEMDRISAQYGQMGLDIMKGGGGQSNYITDPSRFGVTQSEMRTSDPGNGSGSLATVPTTTTAPIDARTPGAAGPLAQPPPAAPAAAPAAAPPPAPTSSTGSALLSRYPGSYDTADLSGTTPPPTTRAPGSVFLGATTAQPTTTAPAPAPVTATPLPPPTTTAQAPPASATMPPPAPGSAAVQQQNQAPDISPNSVNLPGVGPVPRTVAASYFQAMMRGTDPTVALLNAQSARYRRLAELASAGYTSGQWQTNVMQAYNEGLITRADVQREIGLGPQDQLRWVNSLTDATTQMNNAVTLATHGGGLSPTGIGPAAGPQGMIEGRTGAEAAGRGDTRDITFTDPTTGKQNTWTVPAPQVYRFIQEHPGSFISGQAGGAGGDPVAGLPPDQAGPMIAQRESGNQNIYGKPVKLADGSVVRASGYYQFLPDTWQRAARLAGIQNPPAEAIQASRADQDAAFRALYASEGATPWSASNPNRGRAAAAGPPVIGPTVAQTQGVQGGGGPMGQPGGPALAGGPIAQATDPNAPAPTLPNYAARTAPPAPPPAPTPPPAPGGGGNAFVIGDSHAGGLRRAGLNGVSTDGLSPSAVMGLISRTPREQIAGKDVVLSSGAANRPGDAAIAYDEIKALQDKGAHSVKLLGIGPGANPALSETANRQLAMAAGRAGAEFVPLTGDFQPGGVHLRSYAPLAQTVRTSEAAPTAPYQTAGLGFTPPPTQPSQATQAQYLGPYGGTNAPIAAVPRSWSPGPAVTSNIEFDQRTRDNDAGQMNARQQESLAGQSAMRTMDDIMHRLDAVGGFTGAGATWRAKLGQVLKDFSPDVVQRIFENIGGDKFDPTKTDQVRILAKELFQQSVLQERGLTPQGGHALTTMFGDMMPNIGMSGNAIRDMNNVLRVMQQAQLDYSQGSIEHFNRERQWEPLQRDAQGNYTRYHPLSEYDQKFNDPQGPNAPHVYVGAAGLMNGRKDWWSNLSDAQQDAAIATAHKVQPGMPIPDALMPPRYRHG